MQTEPNEHEKRLVRALLRLGRAVDGASRRQPHQPMLLCKQLAALGRSVYALNPRDEAAVDHLVAETDGVRLLFETHCPAGEEPAPRAA